MRLATCLGYDSFSLKGRPKKNSTKHGIAAILSVFRVPPVSDPWPVTYCQVCTAQGAACCVCVG